MLSQASFTPSPQRRRKIGASASPWKSPLQGERDLRPWDISKMPRVLAEALAPKATIETKLRSSNTIRRCTETADKAGRDKLRKEAAFVASLCAIAESVDQSASGARVRVHCVVALVNLLGESEQFDLFATHTDEFDRLLLESIRDEHTIVVSAAAQLLRRISEIESVAHLVVVQDEWFSACCHLFETVDDESVTPHLLSALINVAGNQRAHFLMARSARLLHMLVELLFRCGTQPQRSLQAAKVCANLLAFPDNSAEMKRLAPPLVTATLDCSEVAATRAGGASQSDAGDDQVLAELRDVCRLVLEELHADDLVALHAQLSAELAEGRAVATRMRSHVLSPQALAAEQFRSRLDADWAGTVAAAAAGTYDDVLLSPAAPRSAAVASRLYR